MKSLYRLTSETVSKNYTNIYVVISNVISKPTTTLVWEKERTQQQAMWTKYTNKNEVTIEFSRKREHEHSTQERSQTVCVGL